MAGRKYDTQKKEIDFTKIRNADYVLGQSWSAIENAFQPLGIVLKEKDPAVPQTGDVPRVFVVKDNKVSTLAENGLVPGERAFAEAILRGEVFAFPAGEKEPVQMQMGFGSASAKVYVSDPLKPVPEAEMEKMRPTEKELNSLKQGSTVREFATVELFQEPERKPAPKWYHRMFKFWGSNRQICEEYEQAEQKHREWEKSIKEQKKAIEDAAKNQAMGNDRIAKAAQEYDRCAQLNSVCRAVQEKFGAARTGDALAREVEEQKRLEAERIQAAKEHDAFSVRGKNNKIQTGIEIVENIYAREPRIREDFTGELRNSNSRYYVKEDFDKLTKADIDLSKVQIGGEAVTERQFAMLGMFAANDPEIGMQNQIDAVGRDPKPIVEGCKAVGYTEQEAREIITTGNIQTYSMDVLHTDNRMFKYFNAVNSGRELAANALKAYPQDKSKLADILSRAVEHAGYLAGTTKEEGLKGYAKLCNEAIEMMDRDPELRQMAKEKYEQRDKSFCDRHKLYEHRTFEQLISDVRAEKTYCDVIEKGRKAEQDLVDTRAGLKQMTEQEKKTALRDALKGSMVETMMEKDIDQRLAIHPNAVNKGIMKFEKYIEDITQKVMGDNEGPGVGGAGGSTLPTSLPTVLSGGMRNRAAEKAPTLHRVTDKKWMAQLEANIEGIIREDKLDDKTVDQLAEEVVLPSFGKYKSDKLLARSAQVGAQKEAGPKAPAADKNLEEPDLQAGM